MHKSERLFQLVNLLRGRRLAISARQLADKLAVSERTIYRDIQDLQSQGVPISGEAGVGYILTEYDLPPMMFTIAELQALLLGSKMVSRWTDPLFAEQAQSALAKIEAILPGALKEQLDDSPYMVAGSGYSLQQQHFNRDLRLAINQGLCVMLHYRDVEERLTERLIEPLGMVFWGGKWTLVAFCRLRQGYREFRLDRMVELSLSRTSFVTSADKCMGHYVELVRARYAQMAKEAETCQQVAQNS
ncbi:helix-turn-helix transcriptional regulator [Pseudoalteromonas fenneropenaei]|uniref:Helix-turn-helix transcriptional regulator n=1 Tax=Pseudoalteromonas fenneropenaei TaxID=1737459 RepID=A0ABV7CIY7_9GAMM